MPVATTPATHPFRKRERKTRLAPLTPLAPLPSPHHSLPARPSFDPPPAPRHALPPRPPAHAGPSSGGAEGPQCARHLVMPVRAATIKADDDEYERQWRRVRLEAKFAREHKPRPLPLLIEELDCLLDELEHRAAPAWLASASDPSLARILRRLEQREDILGWLEGDETYAELRLACYVEHMREILVAARVSGGADWLAARCFTRPASPEPEGEWAPVKPKSSASSFGGFGPVAMPAPMNLPEVGLERVRSRSHSERGSRRCTIYSCKES